MLAYLGEQMDPHIDGCPDCRARRTEYQRIAAALAQESQRSLPDGWMEALQAKLINMSVESSSPRIRSVHAPVPVPPVLPPGRPRGGAGGGPSPGVVAASRRTRWLAAGSGVMATVVAAWVILLWPRKPGLETATSKGPVLYRGAEEALHAGDLLRVKGSAGGADRFQLRIYLDGSRLVFRCPGESPPACRTGDDGVTVDYAFPAPGLYEVVWISSDAAIPDPVGLLDTDVNAARVAEAHAEIEGPFHVD